jgi:hypothetical protein
MKVFNRLPTVADNIQGPRDLIDRGFYNVPVPGQGICNGWLDSLSYNTLAGYPLTYTDEVPSMGGLVDKYAKEIIAGTYPKNFLDYSLYMEYLFGSAFNNLGFTSYDREPDIFYFNLNGIHGKFVFDRFGKASIIPYQDIKIEPGIGNNSGPQWIFTTSDGTRYFFENTKLFTEKITVVSDNYPIQDDWHGRPTEKDESKTKHSYVTTWLLSKIQSVNGEVAIFEYEPAGNLHYENENSVVMDHMLNYDGSQIPPGLIGQRREFNRSDVVDVFDRKHLKSIFLKSDNFGAANFTANFSYDYSREDMAQGTSRLRTLTINDLNNKTINTFDFDYGIFNCGCTCPNPKDRTRLKLTKITKGAQVGMKLDPFIFSYNETVNLPCRNSPRQDYWGYYNNNTNPSLVPAVTARTGSLSKPLPGADRSSNETMAQANILTSIQWPEGALTKYQYEINQRVTEDGVIENTGGLRIGTIIEFPDAESEKNSLLTSFYYVKADNSGPSGTGMSVGKQFEIQRHFLDAGGKWAYYSVRTTSSQYAQYLNEPVRYGSVIVAKLDASRGRKSTTEYTLNDFKTSPDMRGTSRIIDLNGISVRPLFNIDNFPAPPAPIISRSHLRGLITNEVQKTSDGKIVKTKRYNYEGAREPGRESIYGYTTDSEDRFFFWGEFVFSSSIAIYQHDPLTVRLKSVVETDYDGQQRASQGERTEYAYHSDYISLVTSVSQTQSDGQTKVVRQHYAVDRLGAVFDEMRARHMIATVIEQETFVGAQKVGGLRNSFKKYGNNILPSLLEGWYGDQYTTDVKEFDYDQAGNVILESRNNGTVKQTIWGYNGLYPIAEVLSTSKRSVFHTSFETNGMPVSLVDRAVTGNRYWNSGSYNFTSNGSFTPNDGPILQMSYWFWENNQWNFSGVVNFNNLIARGSRLDEIRVFPKNAQFTTMTYQLGVGVTSIMDSNSAVKSTSFDVYNRKAIERDSDGNFRKYYFYQMDKIN